MNKKRKLVLSLFVIVFALLATVTATYAYWNSLQKTEDEALKVGSGIELLVAVDVKAPEGKVLVPTGLAYGANDVDRITLTYNVVLDLPAKHNMDLTVISSNVLIGGISTYSDLVKIDITMSSNTINNNLPSIVTVVVTLTEPSSQTIYEAIRNKPITFDLVFEATPIPNA